MGTVTEQGKTARLKPNGTGGVTGGNGNFHCGDSGAAQLRSQRHSGVLIAGKTILRAVQRVTSPPTLTQFN